MGRSVHVRAAPRSPALVSCTKAPRASAGSPTCVTRLPQSPPRPRTRKQGGSGAELGIVGGISRLSLGRSKRRDRKRLAKALERLRSQIREAGVDVEFVRLVEEGEGEVGEPS